MAAAVEAVRPVPRPDVQRALEVLATVDPLSYGVDALRSTRTGVTHFGVAPDLAVLALTSALMLAGSYLFSRIQL
ncbi:MAG: hypothetical protein ACM3SQ_01725 [Betaproteobacteria bacterium]